MGNVSGTRQAQRGMALLLLGVMLAPLSWAVPVANGAVGPSNATQPVASVVNCIVADGARAPRFATTCFGSAWDIASYAAAGDATNGDSPGSDAAIYSFGDMQPDGSADLQAAGPSNGHAAESLLRDVGAVYGLAFSSGRNTASPLAGQQRLYASAFTKRLTRFGPGGPGAIYVTTGGVSAEFVTIPGVVAGPANAPGFAANGQPGDGSTPNFPNGTSPASGSFSPEMGGIHILQNDTTAIQLAGRTGLGDMDIDPQEHFLYVVNLRNRLVYRVDTWNTGNPQATVLALPAPPEYADPRQCYGSGASGPADMRPFGLHVTGDSLYLGVVCSAQSSQDRGDLAAGVLRFDLASGTWTGLVMATLLASFDGQREAPIFNSSWRPWRDDESGDPFGSVGPAFRTYPQPLVGDLEITEAGDMLIGLRDRYGDMTGSSLRLAFSGTSQGDMMRAARTGQYSWAAPTTAGEVYGDNAQYSGNGDPELAGGALALAPGTHLGGPGEDIAGTFMNPYGAQSYGAAWWNTTGGLPQAREELYAFGTGLNRFGKAGGLGDVELLCEYRAIGDRVWRDDNGNGVQDAGEPQINGVLLNLLAADGSQVAQVRTGATTGLSGNYRFYVQPFQNYTVQIDPSNFAPGGPLAGFGATLPNAVGDDLDSDVDSQNRIAVPAGPNRDVNMSFDAGFARGANVRIDKSGPASAAVGATIQYVLAYANDGPSSAANVQIADTLPAGLTFVSSSPAPASVSGQRLSWSIGTIAPSGSGSILVTAQVNVSAGASVTNQATITTTTVGDNPGDNTDTSTTSILRASIQAAKTGPSATVVGSTVSYTLSYANSGNAPAAGVQVVDTLPGGLTFVSANPAPASASGQQVVWNIGSVAAGASGAITVNASVSGAIGGASVSNQVCVTTTSPGALPASACGSATTALQRPDVYVVKTGPATATAGETFSYSLAYGNSGNAAATAAQVTDVLPSGLSFVSATPSASVSGQTLSWSLGTLAPGAAGTITVVVQSDAALAHGASVQNTAQIATSTPGDPLGNNASSTVTMVQRADVWVTKSSSTPFPVESGQSVTYTVDYGNNGPAAARGVQLVDVLPPQLADVQWACVAGCGAQGSGALQLDLGMLNVGATGRISVTGVAQTSLAREDFANLARISTTTPQTRLDNDESSVPGAVWTSDLLVLKLAAPRVVAGTTFTTTLHIQNIGPAPAQAATVQDTLPAGVMLVSSAPAPSAQQGSALTWQLGDMTDGASNEIVLVLAAAADLADGSLVSNTATVVTTTPDRDERNNTSRADTLVEMQADLDVSKSGPDIVYAGEAFDYTLEYHNNGPSWARNVVLTDTLPPDLALVAATPPQAETGDTTLAWRLGDLAPGQSGTMTVRVTSSPEQVDASRNVVNQARIDADTADPDAGDNQAQHQTELETVDLRIVKDMPALIVAGAEFTATLEISNAGPLPARNVSVRDFLPAGLTLVRSMPAPTANGPRWNLGSLDSGASTRLEIILRAPSDAISGTVYLNTATVDTADPDRDGGNNAAQDSSIVRPNADLIVQKRGTTGPVRTGGEVIYTLAYRNAGPSAATGAWLTDLMPEGFVLADCVPPPQSTSGSLLRWQLGDLPAGATGEITMRGRLYGAPGGSQTTRVNRAEIGSDIPDGDPGNNRSAYSIVVEQPDLVVAKDDGQTAALAGESLTYIIRVRNVGAATASGILLREEPPPGSVVLSAEWQRQQDGSYMLPLDDLTAGATTTRQFSLRLPNPLPVLTARNRVVVIHGDPDPTPEDNDDEDVDDITQLRIGDRVWLDGDGDGEQDDGESGLGGVTVRLLDGQTRALLAETTTGAQGDYLFSALRPGRYLVELASDTTQLGRYRGYRATTPTRQPSIVAAATPDDLERDFGLRPAPTTAVHLAELKATLVDDGHVSIVWRTLDELGTLRFRVLWSPTTDRAGAVEIASAPSASSTGARYSVDDDHQAGFYWLIEDDQSGEHLLGVFWPAERPPVGARAQFLPFVQVRP